MTNKIIKVDRVRSASEAVALEDLGATMIAVDLAENERFADHRTLTVEQAAGITGALRTATVVAAMDLTGGKPSRLVEAAKRVGATHVQPLINAVPPPPVRSALRDARLGIVYAGIEISHDDDPGWIFSGHDEYPDLGAALFQVDVLAEYRDAWQFLRDESPEYPEEFQIGDLNALAGDRLILVTLDFTPVNIREIVTKLPGTAGISLVLGEQASRSDLHFHSYRDALGALAALRD
ncbi:hypothetical protein Acy02nite_69460 [Actinoplanes cyaneus]|uniref:Uncharacterized protein n=1 Tax=Actinoplanes cyaneus TaxID=52696 RepID=A0A919M470_9ACTN|nr:hypothetical protein [Actinoplanes cyaneus]MCW2140815.1 hypothetical protein [Actinoplanes cyaneus]GID69065.1 hypothetical protein Acy02nite_69460 [Actinoplanes cyaneus]